jgi:hypothetical protein
MKTPMIAGLILLTLCAGCRPNQTSPTASQTTEISSEGYTWQVGAITIDGTNVPASQLRITAIHGTNALPRKNEASK